MRLERTEDMELVKEISLSEDVAWGNFDDRYKNLKDRDWSPALHPALANLLVFEDVTPIEVNVLGLIQFHPDQPHPTWPDTWGKARQIPVWQGHVAFLKPLRGKKAREAYGLGFNWLWAHTAARCCIGVTPEDNKPARRMARWAGMKPLGIRREAYLRNGTWVDGIISILARPEEHSMEAA